MLTLTTGTTIAQAIPIAISPILTRIYTPDDFGVFALFIAITSITSIVSTGRYELAIMLPKKDSNGAHLVALSVCIAMGMSVIALIFILLFNQSITNYLGKPEISDWLYFIPLSIFLTGLYQSLNYWSNRKKKYKRLALSRVLQTSSISAVQIGSGFYLTNTSGLILGDSIGKIVSTGLLTKLVWEEDKKDFNQLSKKKIISLAKRYKNFPLYDVGASLANTSAYQIQNILFPALYGLTSAGHYFLVLRALQAPISLINSAITDVYRQKLTAKQTTPDQLKTYYKKMLYFLFCVGIMPFTLLTLFSEEFFPFVFGRGWSEAGKYAAILSPMFFIRFIANPLSYFLYLKEKQKLNVLAHMFMLGISIVSLYFFKSVHEVVLSISVGFSIIYMWYIIYAAKLSGAIIFGARNGR
ncbi:MAG: oligosaccharide flippase family protein [Methyloglobulus sp.]|nr:oligosaccharide flippase family protein [Methyloglobulus sp.]